MKKRMIKLALAGAALMGAFSSQAANVFTCDAIVKDVRARSDGNFDVSVRRYDGVFMDAPTIEANRSYLLGQVLVAQADGLQGIEYTLIVQTYEGNDTRCRDNNEDTYLIGLVKK